MCLEKGDIEFKRAGRIQRENERQLHARSNIAADTVYAHKHYSLAKTNSFSFARCVLLRVYRGISTMRARRPFFRARGWLASVYFV